MTRFSIKPASEIQLLQTQGRALASLQLLQLKAPQLTGNEPIKIDRTNYLVDSTKPIKFSQTMISAVSNTGSPNNKSLLLFEPLSMKESALPSSLADIFKTSQRSFSKEAKGKFIYVGLGNLKGNALFLHGRKIDVDERTLTNTPIKVEVNVTKQKMRLTKLSLSQSVPLIKITEASLPSSSTSNRVTTFSTLINALFKNTLTKEKLNTAQALTRNRLMKRIQQLGAQPQSQKSISASNGFLKQKVAGTLNIPNLAQLISADKVKHELFAMMQFQPQQTSQSDIASFAETIKLVWQLLVNKSKGHNFDSKAIQTLQKELQQYQHHELNRLFTSEDLKLFTELNNQIIRYQAASHFSDDVISWFFGIPYWHQNRVEYLEGHFEQEKKDKNGNSSPLWTLELKFNISLGSFLIKVDSYNDSKLDITIRTNHKLLIERIATLQDNFEQRLVLSGFMVKSFAIQQAQVPLSLLEPKKSSWTHKGAISA